MKLENSIKLKKLSNCSFSNCDKGKKSYFDPIKKRI